MIQQNIAIAVTVFVIAANNISSVSAQENANAPPPPPAAAPQNATALLQPPAVTQRSVSVQTISNWGSNMNVSQLAPNNNSTAATSARLSIMCYTLPNPPQSNSGIQPSTDEKQTMTTVCHFIQQTGDSSELLKQSLQQLPAMAPQLESMVNTLQGLNKLSQQVTQTSPVQFNLNTTSEAKNLESGSEKNDIFSQIEKALRENNSSLNSSCQPGQVFNYNCYQCICNLNGSGVSCTSNPCDRSWNGQGMSQFEVVGSVAVPNSPQYFVPTSWYQGWDHLINCPVSMVCNEVTGDPTNQLSWPICWCPL